MTQVFRVERGVDTLIEHYDWYGSDLHISDAPDPTLIRLELDWQNLDPDEAAQRLAIGIYRGGEVIREYYISEVQRLNGVGRSYWRSLGFLRLGVDHGEYRLKSADGHVLTIDLNTGDLRLSKRPAGQ